jgi:sigma-E factor negative regulatory protein RseA
MKPHPPGSAAHGEPSDETLRTWLSELADGEADVAGNEGACHAWRERADMRCTWHSYHLIGDVLRSEELARPPVRDADFLAQLRSKLAAEPIVVAPMPPRAPGQAALSARDGSARMRRRQSWLFPAAAAAGFMAVAGVLVLTRVSAPGVAAPDVAVIRDARLDAYLQAHQSVRGGSAAAVPGVGLRSVDVVVPAGGGR